jgi:CxxC motif-containing protein (DUF1111 family)
MKASSLLSVLLVSSPLLGCNYPAPSLAQSAHDPGPRPVLSGDPTPIPGLSSSELAMWNSAKDKFRKADTVTGDGLGPTFNLDSCEGCHRHPQMGGSSPPKNPQYIYWQKYLQSTNKLPDFITENGPAREVRYKRNPDGSADGGVHDIFTITGLPGAGSCAPTPSDFDRERRDNNIIFRIPTPTFGLGLVEAIPDEEIIERHAATLRTISANKSSDAKRFEEIDGKLNIINTGHTNARRVNRNGNDGTVSRFGWKAQNKSLLVFSGEAYNVEMGISNELFETERDESPNCKTLFGTPNDTTNADPNRGDPYDVLSDIERFAIFMRFLAPPTPSFDQPGGAASISAGKDRFNEIGCGLCHTPTLRTGVSKVAALRNKDVNLYSDLVLHNMGRGLEDGISQGAAAGNEFRTAPLWGLGQRLFFLHDGRTTDLVQAIMAHRSTGSEANRVVDIYDALSDGEKQDLLNFLRSL